MNERIKEISAHSFVKIPTLTHGVLVKLTDVEKFAELIVKECMAQCERVATDADAMTKSEFVTDAGRQLYEGMWGGANNCASWIKEHFGVEE